MTVGDRMYRFVCNAWPEYKIVDGTGHRVLAFHHGVLDTDERGALLIRADPLFGRRFFESDPEAPVHGAIPEGAAHAIVNAPPETPYCGICDKVFARSQDLKAHMTKAHGGDVACP